MIGNIKLANSAKIPNNVDIEMANNDHGFRPEDSIQSASSTSATTNDAAPASTLDEPVSETIVCLFFSLHLLSETWSKKNLVETEDCP